MRPVRFIDDQRSAVAVRNPRDCRNIRDHPVIGGRSQEDGADILVPQQRILDLRRGDGPVQILIQALIQVRIQIYRPEPVQPHCMKRGAVAVARHDKTAAGLCAGADGAQDSRRAAIYEKMSLAASVERGCAHLGLLQDSFGMMEIVESVNLGEINQGGVAQMSRAPLMSRHMERIGAGEAVLCQCVIKIHNSIVP